MLWLSHYTRDQYKTKKEKNFLIIVVIYLVLLFRESLKGGWGWVRGWLSTNLFFPPFVQIPVIPILPQITFLETKGEAKPIPSKLCTFPV